MKHKKADNRKQSFSKLTGSGQISARIRPEPDPDFFVFKIQPEPDPSKKWQDTTRQSNILINELLQQNMLK